MCINIISNGKNSILINPRTGSLLMIISGLLLVSGCLAVKTPAVTTTTISYEQSDGDHELTASCYLTDSEAAIVFLPSVYAPLEDQEALTAEIGNDGLSACFSQVFTDLFLPMERRYYEDIPLASMLGLLATIHQQTSKLVYFVAHGAGTRMAYKLAEYARNNQSEAALSGLILLSPNLLGETPEPGQAQQYMTQLDEKVVPVFIFQPSYSPHHWHLEQLLNKINASGTLIRHQRLADVRDGYALREDRTPKEQELRERAAELFDNAIRQLREMQ